MTLTYRLDSDVFWNYGLFIDKETGSIVAPSKYVKWREPEAVDDPQLLKFIKQSKTKQAAWFLSHCGAKSFRDNLGTKIQEFMDVDIYGACGNLTCPLSIDIYNTEGRQVCTDMLNTTYKFYFSFENSICTDYMTEKVFLNMDNYVIPILYNGVTDMQHFLPPKSYIHVNDFNSIEELANYLKFLDINPQEYANYFWWKKYYKVTDNVHKYSYCDMCMKINNWNVRKKRNQYLDVAEWFGHKACYKMGNNFK
ncbi:alpha-(1,3)-fucosyltransferase C-like [Chironomus tepperi]|uniref:alpha-(1,3)-fucosyltransferase C-like n=1 Tax=Chironomus tepperi TaxID=113505 RepID=UPI00391F14FE